MPLGKPYVTKGKKMPKGKKKGNPHHYGSHTGTKGKMTKKKGY